MATGKLPTPIKKNIEDLLKDIQRDNIIPEKVYLFGSYARGLEHEGSDFDICVVSSSFSDFTDSLQYLLTRKSIIESNYPIEPIGLTPKDMRNDSHPLASEIRKYGIEIPIP
jgi:predicted nucleotidyltransferase